METNVARTDARYAVHRIPTALIDPVRLPDGRAALVRPVLPQDAELQQDFVRRLSPASRARRFHGTLSELTPPLLRYMTEVDYVTHVGLVAEVFERGRARQVAEARWVRRAEAPDCADFAIAVADDWQRAGLGTRLLALLERSARQQGIRCLCGDVQSTNAPMMAFLWKAGWTLHTDLADRTSVCARREFQTTGAQAAWPVAA